MELSRQLQLPCPELDPTDNLKLRYGYKSSASPTKSGYLATAGIEDFWLKESNVLHNGCSESLRNWNPS